MSMQQRPKRRVRKLKPLSFRKPESLRKAAPYQPVKGATIAFCLTGGDFVVRDVYGKMTRTQLDRTDP